MKLRTLTFDSAQYKLMPLQPTEEITLACDREDQQLTTVDDIYRAGIAAVPDTLPGVVEHSGEPAAYIHNSDRVKNLSFSPNQLFLDAQDDGASVTPLFTHAAPAQPVERKAQTLSDSEFLSKRLSRVASLVGVPMPDMTHEGIAEVAGTILGSIALKLERNNQAVERQELSDAEIEAIAGDGMRNAFGGIYSTSVIEFARAIIAKDRGQA